MTTHKNRDAQEFVWSALQGIGSDVEMIYIFEAKLKALGAYMEQRHPKAFRDMLNYLKSEELTE